MADDTGELDASIQAKIDGDQNFQESLSALGSDEEREHAVNTRKTELLREEAADLFKKAKDAGKNKELADNYKTRAEKAETKVKELENAASSNNKGGQQSNLSPGDVVALSKVHEEDVQEVLDWATFKKVSVKEALKDEKLKAVLTHNEEVRKSANAAQVKPSGQSANKSSPSEVIQKAKSGNFMEMDPEELANAHNNSRPSATTK